jgi:hypothetical protein
VQKVLEQQRCIRRLCTIDDLRIMGESANEKHDGSKNNENRSASAKSGEHVDVNCWMLP